MTRPIRPRAPTLKDLAREAGVSLTSASYAINCTGSVGPRTRAHVLEVAARLGFRPNLNARTMKAGRSGIVGLVVPDLGNPFFAALAQAVFRAGRAAGYQVYLTNTEGAEELERGALAMAVGLKVDGLLWFSIRDQDTSAGMLANTPTVLLERTVGAFPSVGVDNHGAGVDAADHLLAHGHRDIGMVTGPMDIASMRDRCTGFRDRVRERGRLAFELENAFSPDLEPEVGAALLARRATALFCAADVIAIGAVRFAQDHGLEVPGDLSVMGFDDIDLAALIRPALTTMEIAVEEIATAAVEALWTATPGAVPPLRVALPARVVARGTVAAPGELHRSGMEQGREG